MKFTSYDLLKVMQSEGIEAMIEAIKTDFFIRVYDEKSTAGTDASRKRAIENYKKKAHSGAEMLGGFAMTDGISALWIKDSVEGVKENDHAAGVIENAFKDALQGEEVFEDIRESLRVWLAKNKPESGYITVNGKFYTCENVAKVYNAIAENSPHGDGRPKMKQNGNVLLIATRNGAGLVMPISAAVGENCTYSDFENERRQAAQAAAM